MAANILPITGAVLHDGAGAQAFAPRECGVVSAWRGLAGDVEGALSGTPEDAVPIGHVTNGVHVPSWLAPQMCRLYDRHLGVGWQQRSGRAQTWEEIENVDDGELWETHLSLKSQLLDFVRQRAHANRRNVAANRRRRCNG